MITIMDPTDEHVPVQRQVSPRQGTIAGRIALLDISKARGNVLLDHFQALIKQRLPELTLERFAKPTFSKPAPDDLRREIRDRADFVIEALAD